MEVCLMGFPPNTSAQADFVRKKWAELNSRASDLDLRRTYIGVLEQVYEKTLFCNVCRLIWAALCQRNGGKNPPLTWKGRDLECHTMIRPYGYFYVDRACKEKQDIRRLSIEIGVTPLREGDMTGDASYECQFALQACDNFAPNLSSICEDNGAQLTMDKMSFGGRERPVRINFRAIKWWLRLCETEHGCHLDGSITREEMPDSLRMIDVKAQCVVPAATMQTPRYVALSYVWGGPQKVTLRKETFDVLTKPGVFQDILLPQTIADAIAVVEILGERYLWVDSLCIIQDQTEDRVAQIQCMDLIYTGALLTIIAASGKDSDAGLPGLRPSTRTNVQVTAQVMRATVHTRPDEHVLDHHGMSLMTTLTPQKIEFDHYLEETTWYTRGWTMQERVLSKRNLIFTGEQVHWECEGGSWCEESEFDFWSRRFYRYAKEPSLLPPRVMMHPRLGRQAKLEELNTTKNKPSDDQWFWGHYCHLVMRFTQRKFTNDGDMSDAFAGILRPLSRIHNMRFIWGHPETRFSKMLMWSGCPSGRREAMCIVPSSNGAREVMFPSWSWMGWKGGVSLNFAFVYVPEILCFYQDENWLLRTFDEIDRANDSISVAVAHEDAECPWKPNKVTQVTKEDIEHHYPDLSKYPENRTHDSILFFWASSARFSLKWDNAGVSGIPVIYNKSSDYLGSTDQMTRERWYSEGFESGTFEFIVVGRDPLSDEKDGNPKLQVLQIEWKDGIAYRTNSGFLFEKGWMAAKRTWKMIALG
jgi:hypothetical protein